MCKITRDGWPEEIYSKIHSFAVVLNPAQCRNKEYVIATYFKTEEEMQTTLSALGLIRRNEFVYDPAYPYKAGKGEKLIGSWYMPGGNWICSMDRDIQMGHPAEKEAEAWAKTHGREGGDVLDEIFGEKVV